MYIPLLATTLPIASDLAGVILLLVEFLGCLWTGILAGNAFVEGESAGASAGRLFAVDLFGSAAGFLFGGGILLFWHGITVAAFISTGTAAVGMLISCRSRNRR